MPSTAPAGSAGTAAGALRPTRPDWGRVLRSLRTPHRLSPQLLPSFCSNYPLHNKVSGLKPQEMSCI